MLRCGQLPWPTGLLCATEATRSVILAVYMQPLLVLAQKPTDEEIAERLAHRAVSHPGTSVPLPVGSIQ